MLGFIGNLNPIEILVILVVAVLIFGKDLPQAASKAYLQVRKLRNAVDDLRRETGIDRELRNIERNVREAEWEARRTDPQPTAAPRRDPAALPRAVAPPQQEPPASPAGADAPTTETP